VKWAPTGHIPALRQAQAGASIRDFRLSPVAQLVEQAAVNRRVVGSSPTGGAPQPASTTTRTVVNGKGREDNLSAFFVYSVI
jgi:hypothetical protein